MYRVYFYGQFSSARVYSLYPTARLSQIDDVIMTIWLVGTLRCKPDTETVFG